MNPAMNPMKKSLASALALTAILAGSAVHAAPATTAMKVMQSGTIKSQVLNLPKGRSAVIDLPADAADVFVSNPAVADAVLRTPRRIFVLGVDAGQSDAIFFDASGRQILNLQIRVDASTDHLADAVARLFPNSKVEVQSLAGKVVLSGMARNNGEADQIFRLAQGFASKPEDVVNLISIAGKDQVTLKVRVAEVNRTIIKQLGFDTQALIGKIGGVQYSLAHAPTYGVNNKLLGGLIGGYKVDTTMQPMLQIPCSDPQISGCYDVIHSANEASNWKTATARETVGYDGLNKGSAQIQAFERVGLIRTLAEPNLTAVSGESAKFLAGGEFPVPVAQDNQGRVTVDFKPFGVGLGFTPVVLSEGRISLKVSTEVSELSNIGSLQLSSSLTIPALSVRRAETAVEMSSGSSLMIAGLLQSKYKQTVDALPGMTTLPVLGPLFRSRDFLNEESELVIIITPYIVQPGAPGDFQTPADNLEAPHDMHAVFMGNVNRVIKARNGDTATTSASPAYSAPVGYVIE
jgi:pilus assembly protein CpaC